MDITVFLDYLSPIILIACLVVGYLVKNVVPNQTVNKFIPLIVAVLGMLLNIWVVGVLDLPTLVTGAISGLASTGCYELFDQLIKQIPNSVKSNKE